MKEQFGLYLILTAPEAGYAACAQAAVECGVRYLQLRMKDATPEDQLETARALRRITAGSTTRLIINDHTALAAEVDADGVHLGQDDQSLIAARAAWNKPGKLFGLSTHSMEQAMEALKQKPDYIGIGPVFPTQTKPLADPTLGPQEAGRIAASIDLTSVVIGGIDTGNLPDILNAGAANFCCIRAVNSSKEPKSAILELQRIWKRYEF